MIAQLIRGDGTIARQWHANDVEAAMTADRNCPPGWRVEISAEQEAASVASEAMSYLSGTDWYVLRKMDGGKAVPKDVAKTRAAARKILSGDE